MSTDVQVSSLIRFTTSRRNLAGSWMRFCALRKIVPNVPGWRPSDSQDVPVVHLQLVAVAVEQRLPVEPVRDHLT
ncbi:MAG: hypothetical protein ACK5OX_05785 [Desertimonas sp.]